MRVYVTSKFVENMTKEEKKACSKFALSGGKEVFSIRRPVKSDGRLRVWIARVGDEIMGWSVCDMTNTASRRRDFLWRENRVLDWAMNGYEAGVILNVKPKYRRRGIGTRLVKKAIAYGRSKKKAVRVFPHDKKSESFYEKMDVIVGKKARLRKECY